MTFIASRVCGRRRAGDPVAGQPDDLVERQQLQPGRRVPDDPGPAEFPVAARVGWPAADLVSKLDAAIRYQWRASNLTVAQGGGGIETSGTVEAVDSMLMQSVSGTIRLFADADWPAAKDASFTRLRAVGAFTVSAALTGGTVGPVTITSDAGQPVRLRSPWAGGQVTVTSNGAPVPFTVDGGVISFATTAGSTYQVSAGPSTSNHNRVPFTSTCTGSSLLARE